MPSLRGFVGGGALQLQIYLLGSHASFISIRSFIQHTSRRIRLVWMPCCKTGPACMIPEKDCSCGCFLHSILVGQVIKKLLMHKTDAMLLLPAWVCYWTAILSSLPIRDECYLPYYKGMFGPILGSRLPPSMQQSGCPYALKAYWVKF